MAEAEDRYSNIFRQVTYSDLESYQLARHFAEEWLYYAYRPTGVSTFDFMRADEALSSLKSTMGIAATSTRSAVVLSMAQSWNCWMYSENDQRPPKEQLISAAPPEIRGMLVDSFDLIEELQPTTHGQIADVSLDKIQTRNTSLRESDFPDTLGIFGLNGVGKTNAIEGIRSFCNQAGIKLAQVKFPRREGTPMSGAIIKALADEESKQLSGNALQALMIADHFEWIARLENDSPLQLLDRAVPFDGLVYPEQELARVMSAMTYEAAVSPITAVVLESCPLACYDRVVKRSEGKLLRKFERSPEMMADQAARIAALGKLPFVRFVNTDVPGKVTPARLADIQARVVSATIMSGVLARQLVRQGKYPDKIEAQRYIKDSFGIWFRKRSRGTV